MKKIDNRVLVKTLTIGDTVSIRPQAEGGVVWTVIEIEPDETLARMESAAGRMRWIPKGRRVFRVNE